MRLLAAPILLINAQVLNAPLPPQQGVLNNPQQAQPVNAQLVHPPQVQPIKVQGQAPPQQQYQQVPPQVPPQAPPQVPPQAPPPQGAVPVQQAGASVQQVQAQVPVQGAVPVQAVPAAAPQRHAQAPPSSVNYQGQAQNGQPQSAQAQNAQNVQPQLVSVNNKAIPPSAHGQGVPYVNQPVQYLQQGHPPQYPPNQQILLPNAQAVPPNLNNPHLNLYGGAMPPMMVPPNYPNNHPMKNQQGIPILPHPDNIPNAPPHLMNPQLEGLYHPLHHQGPHQAPAGPLRDIDLPDEEYRHLQAQQNIYKQQPPPGNNHTDVVEDLAAEWDRVMTDFMPDMIVTFRLAASTQEYFNQDVGKEPVLLRGGFFESTDDSASSISFQVVSPSGKVVYRNDKGEGLFRIMTEEQGTYTFAVTNSGWSGQKYVTFVVGVGMEKGLTAEDVETLDGNVRVLYRMLGDMETQSSYLWIRQKSALESLHRTASQTYYALVVGLIIAGLATLFQISIIKRMVAHRRLF